LPAVRRAFTIVVQRRHSRDADADADGKAASTDVALLASPRWGRTRMAACAARAAEEELHEVSA
jgi:hypothetical protein